MTKQTEPRKIPHHAVVPLNANKYGLAQNYRVITPDFHLARSRHMSRSIPTQRQKSTKNLTRFYKRGVLGRATRSTLIIEQNNSQPKYKIFLFQGKHLFSVCKYDSRAAWTLLRKTSFPTSDK